MATTRVDPPLPFPDWIIEATNSVVSMVVIATMLEPEEITAVAQGKLSKTDLQTILPKRLPGGGEFSATRLVRGLGVRNPPEELDAFYTALTAAS